MIKIIDIKKLSTLLLLILAMACDSSKTETGKEDINLDDVPSVKGMVIIPGGTYTMGGRSDQAAEDEFPRHEVVIDAFYMDETEVTNAQFLAFVEETGYLTVAEKDIDWEEMKKQLPEGTPKPADSVLQAGSILFKATTGAVNLNDYSQWWEWKIGANWRQPEGPGSTIDDRMDHPVVHVAWDDAIAYAKWSGKRLPTEAEWEWASLGGDLDAKYPWGNESAENATDKANFWQGLFPYQNLELDGFYGTAPVKSFQANGYGLYDMAGNVWEWCSDKYDAQAYAKFKSLGTFPNPVSDRYYDPRDPYSPKHVVRGGSYLCNDSYCSGYRSARRMSSSKDSGLSHTGFRLVKDMN